MRERYHPHVRHREEVGSIKTSEAVSVSLWIDEVTMVTLIHKNLGAARRDLGLDGIVSCGRKQLDLQTNPFLLPFVDELVREKR